MASESEIEIQDVGDVQIQEVEVEQIPIEMPIETVEVSDETTISQPMIALQPIPGGHEEIILQTAGEEVVGDPNLVYVDTIPVAPEIEISTEDVPSTSKRGKSIKKKIGKTKIEGETSFNEFLVDPSMTPRKWEQKQVQIRTLEGEFSVTMWASGKSLKYLRYKICSSGSFVKSVGIFCSFK